MKNLSNVDFDKKLVRILSPRSKSVLEGLGLDEEKLFKISKKDYLGKNIKLLKEKEEIQDKRYEHYEKRRLEKIEEARELYNEIKKI